MQKFLGWLEHILTPLAEVMGESKYLVAIRDGFLLSIFLLIVGSVFLLTANFPLPRWDIWMSHLFDKDWAAMMSVPASAGFNIMTILAVTGIVHSLGKQFNVDAMQAGVTALVSSFIVTPYQTLFAPEGSSKVYEVTSLLLKWMGFNGLFLGMTVVLIATCLFVVTVRKGRTIKTPEGVPPIVVKSFEALVPSFLVVTLMFLVNWLAALTPYDNLQDAIFGFLQTPLSGLGDVLGAMSIAYLFLHFFQFFGINEGSVVGAIFSPVLRALSHLLHTSPSPRDTNRQYR